MNYYRELFYWLYIFSEKAPVNWGSEYKAFGILTLLEFAIITSLLNYYHCAVHYSGLINTNYAYFIGIMFYLKTILYFTKINSWEDIIRDMKKKNSSYRRQSLLRSLLIMGLIIINLLFSYYLFATEIIK